MYQYFIDTLGLQLAHISPSIGLLEARPFLANLLFSDDDELMGRNYQKIMF